MASEFSTPPASNDDGRVRRKRRKVHSAGGAIQDDEDLPMKPEEDLQVVNLQRSPGICTQVSHKMPLCDDSKCLGYLDGVANETFRHSFFRAPSTRSSSYLPVKMSEMLSRPAETSINFVEQLKLARMFVLAVLKFHSTPWLREYWSLHDLSFFPSNDGDDDATICSKTAHLSLDFIQPSQCDDGTAQMKDAGDKETAENAQLTHGVRNLTLWSLGAVLLQIGTWSSIERLDDVANVRRLAQRVPMLGRRYRDLTKQCLECDFAVGDDLSRPRLQEAVYQTVVCGLTDMINSLDIGDG